MQDPQKRIFIYAKISLIPRPITDHKKIWLGYLGGLGEREPVVEFHNVFQVHDYWS